MLLKEVENYYNKILNKGYTIGIDFDDYVFLKSLLYDAEHSISFDEKKEELINKLSYLLQKIYKSGILHTFTQEQCEYICKNSFLLPLVLANNNGKKIGFYRENSYAFNCQFGPEEGTSLGVTDYKNLMYCYQCKKGYNNISYLETIEKLNYKEVLQLLCQVYLFEIKAPNDNLNDLVLKYKDAILSDEYMYLLNKGYERLITKGIVVLDNQSVEEIYNKRFETIERIRNNEYDSDFKKLVNHEPKVLILK